MIKDNKIVLNIYYGYADDGSPIIDYDSIREEFEHDLGKLEFLEEEDKEKLKKEIERE